MKRFLFILFFLLPVSLFAGQTFTIPQGTTTYGPFSVTSLKHYAHFEIDRSLWINPAITLDATFEESVSGSSGPWTRACRLISYGGKLGVSITSGTCPLNPAATHMRIIAVVAGGSIVLSKAPIVENK